MRLTAGTKVGPYEVLDLLGAGGMAEVYRARDTRLRRDVALKVVTEALGKDTELLARLEREARLGGSLNHPNVVAVYDVGLHDGSPYFVTELLQGETLRERLAKGPVPLGTALDWAAQMAQGLAAAHERGIIHRDLKPENVFITRDGPVKLLDFGIAKLVEAAREAAPHGLMDETVSPSGSRTGTGIVLGTPGYMSPEQVRGDPVDTRTDIFNLGSVLYELLSSRRAFPAGPVVEVGYAILHNEPEPLPVTVPQPVAQVVHRCLEKDPRKRFQSARDLAFNFELLRGATGAAAVMGSGNRLAVHRPRWQRWGFPLAVVLAALGLGEGALLSRRTAAPLKPPTVEQITFGLGSLSGARFAPDGRIIFSAAFDGQPTELFSRSPGAFESQPLGLRDMGLQAVSRAGELAVALHPTTSASTHGRGTLAVVSGAGATPREVAESVDAADWGPGGELALVRVLGEKRQLEYPLGTVVFETTGRIFSPRVSPSGDTVAFIHWPPNGSDELVLVDRQGRARTLAGWKVFMDGLAWVPDGSQVLLEAEPPAIWSVSLSGDRRLLYQSVGHIRVEDISQAGTVLVSQQQYRDEVALQQQDQKRERRLSPFQEADLRSLSDDGKTVLFSVAVPVEFGGGFLAYLRRTDGSPPVKLGSGYALTLSPDGKWALVLPDGARDFLSLLPTGPGTAKKVPVVGLNVVRARWPQSGERIVLLVLSPDDQQLYLYVLPLSGGTPRRISGALSSRAFEVSRDNAQVAAQNLEGTVTLYPLDGGASTALPELGKGVQPTGWTSDGQLWVQEPQSVPSHLSLFDLHTRRVVEERRVGPSDLAGVVDIQRIRITPDGGTLAFDYMRQTAYLFLVDGLISERR